VSDVGENVAGSIPMILRCKPSRRFGAEQHADEEKSGTDALTCQRDHPSSHGLHRPKFFSYIPK
jgi:hypothetical protein